jgi:hypothetical protein
MVEHAANEQQLPSSTAKSAREIDRLENQHLGTAGQRREPSVGTREAGWMWSQRLLSFTGFSTALVSAFGVAFWATGPSFTAKFGPIDDHEPLIWMGPDGHLPWSEFWTTFINKTEIGQWGASGRFRPAYYLFRVGETVLFGNNPWAWYVCVLVMFTAACAVLGYVAAVWLSTAVNGSRASIRWSVTLLGSAVCAFLFAGLYAWSAIVGRLGPSEQLGLLATPVVLLSLTKLSLGLGRLWWIPALLGVTTAIFAKESFFSFALAFPLVGTYSYFTFGRRKIDLVAGLLGLLPAVGLALILAPTLLRNQHDVYGANVGSSRFAGAISALTEPPLRQWFLAGTVVILAWCAMTVTMPKAERRVPAFLLAVIVWLTGCVFLDAWFYGGNYTLPRYRAIPDLVIAAQFIGAACLSIVAILRSRRHSVPVIVLATASVMASSIFILRLVQASVSNLQLTHENAIYHAATSNEYQHGLSDALARLAVEEKPTVAVVATNGSDYEPAYAVLNELARRSRDRFREYLIVENASRRTNGLLDPMVRISKSGAPSWHTRPVSEIVGGHDAVCIFLNKNPGSVDGCRRGDGIRLVAQGM